MTSKPSFVAAIEALDLTVVSYLSGAALAGFALPRDLVGRDGKTMIVYRGADREYDFNGWAPWHDGFFGGRYESIDAALGWVQRAKDVRAGKAEDFR